MAFGDDDDLPNEGCELKGRRPSEAEHRLARRRHRQDQLGLHRVLDHASCLYSLSLSWLGCGWLFGDPV